MDVDIDRDSRFVLLSSLRYGDTFWIGQDIYQVLKDAHGYLKPTHENDTVASRLSDGKITKFSSSATVFYEPNLKLVRESYHQRAIKNVM